MREKPVEIRQVIGEGIPAGSPAAQSVAAQIGRKDVPLARQGINEELEGGRGIESTMDHHQRRRLRIAPEAEVVGEAPQFDKEAARRPQWPIRAPGWRDGRGARLDCL